MISNKTPDCITYKDVRPRGYATKLKRWKLNPQASYNKFAKNELIRFVIEEKNGGVVDPYQIYVELTVSTSVAMQGNGGVIMLDGPSTSMFQSLIIYSDSKIIERIDEHDQLGNILHDVQYAPFVEAYRQFEGYSYNDKLTNDYSQQLGRNLPAPVTSFTYHVGTGVVGTTQELYQGSYQSRFRPFAYPTYLNYQVTNKFLNWSQNTQAGNQTGIVPGVNKTQAEQHYNEAMPTPTMLAKSRYDLMFQECDAEYGIQGPDSYTKGANSSDNSATCRSNGYILPFSPSISRNKSQYISPVGHKLKLVLGKIIQDENILLGGSQAAQTATKKTQTTKIKLLVPLLSGCLGILIPKSEWKLLPLEAFKQLMFEFRLNPYAFFSAGYYSSGTADADLIKAEWQVENIQMVFDIWYYDQTLTQQIRNNLNGEGIILSSTSFTLGPIYNIIANGTVTNNWQINNGIESCRALFFWFLSNQYMKKPFYRKQFRLSHNIKSVQVKVGPDLIPPYPIEGCTGNIGLNDDNTAVDGDNTDFIVELQKAMRKLFDCKAAVTIDKLAYALNGRCYTDDDATYGCALFEEMRLKGQFLGVINFDQNQYDFETLTGLDTTKTRPIELVIKGTDKEKYPEDSTMYVMFIHDFIVQLNNNGVSTFGQG